MDAPVNMSLDDIIKSKRTIERTRGRGRGRGRGSGRSFRGGRVSGPVRRGPLAVNARPSSFGIAKPPRRQARSFPWQTDLFEDSIRAAGIQGIEVGTKLYVSNLERGVTNEDIRELFSEIGDVKRYAIHYDSTGRPSGSAEVVYTRRSDAFLAFKRYNNVLLDGKPMKIEIVGANTANPVSPRVNITGLNGKRQRTVIMPGQQRGGGGRAVPMVNRGTSTGMWVPSNRNAGRGAVKNSSGRGGRAGRGRGGGRGNGRGAGGGRGGGGGGKRKGGVVEKSAEQLDKELDSYHAEAMNI